MSGEPWQIYLVSADGGSPERIVRMDRDLPAATWSPDGKLLAISTAGPTPTDIYVVDVHSRKLQTLVGSHGLFAPRWSPDGRDLVAIKDDWTKLMLFSFATQKWTDLVEMKKIGSPQWSRDGRHVYFSALEAAVFNVRVSDRAVQRVASLSEIRLAIGPFWWQMGLAPDDSPLVLRDVGGEDIYALDLDLPKASGGACRALAGASFARPPRLSNQLIRWCAPGDSSGRPTIRSKRGLLGYILSAHEAARPGRDHPARQAARLPSVADAP